MVVIENEHVAIDRVCPRMCGRMCMRLRAWVGVVLVVVVTHIEGEHVAVDRADYKRFFRGRREDRPRPRVGLRLGWVERGWARVRARGSGGWPKICELVCRGRRSHGEREREAEDRGGWVEYMCMTPIGVIRRRNAFRASVSCGWGWNETGCGCVSRPPRVVLNGSGLGCAGCYRAKYHACP